MKHLLRLTDVLEDFGACEYALKTPVHLRIGLRTSTWQLLLSPPMFPGAHREHTILVQLQRWPSSAHVDDRKGEETQGASEAEAEAAVGSAAGDGGNEIARFDEVRSPDLLAIAQAYGIDPDARIWELVWGVPAHAMTIARGHDPRWPNTHTRTGA